MNKTYRTKRARAVAKEQMWVTWVKVVLQWKEKHPKRYERYMENQGDQFRQMVSEGIKRHKNPRLKEAYIQKAMETL